MDAQWCVLLAPWRKMRSTAQWIIPCQGRISTVCQSFRSHDEWKKHDGSCSCGNQICWYRFHRCHPYDTSLHSITTAIVEYRPIEAILIEAFDIIIFSIKRLTIIDTLVIAILTIVRWVMSLSAIQITTIVTTLNTLGNGANFLARHVGRRYQEQDLCLVSLGGAISYAVGIAGRAMLSGRRGRPG